MATYWLHRGEHVEGARYRVFRSERRHWDYWTGTANHRSKPGIGPVAS